MGNGFWQPPGHPKDGDRTYQAVSLQFVEHIVDRHRVPRAGVGDLLEAGQDSLSVDVYLVAEVRPVIIKGAETMNTIFNRQNHAKSA